MKPTISIITDKWIKQHDPCQEAVAWCQKEFPNERDTLTLLKLLCEQKKYSWANWLIVRVMDYKDYVSYAIYAAEQVINIYAQAHPRDNRPQQALDAARKCIDDPSEVNKAAAWAAAAAEARAEAEAAAAAEAAWAAEAAAWAAEARAEAEAEAAAARAAAMQKKILNYGIRLLMADKR